jgi:hypothetical protein
MVSFEDEPSAGITRARATSTYSPRTRAPGSFAITRKGTESTADANSCASGNVSASAEDGSAEEKSVVTVR